MHIKGIKKIEIMKRITKNIYIEFTYQNVFDKMQPLYINPLVYMNF